MSMLSNLDLICRVPLFSELTSSQAKFLAGTVVKRRFKRGELIVEQGRKSDALYLILSGRTRVLMQDDRGREVILATLQAGDYIGEMSLIDNEPHSATVEAMVQTDVLVLGRSEFMGCLATNAALVQSVMRGVVRRLRQADRKIGSLALMSVYGRVADVLTEMAQVSPQQDMVVREKVSRQEVAKMVGASREMVSRVMKDFEERGFIKMQSDGSMQVLGPWR